MKPEVNNLGVLGHFEPPLHPPLPPPVIFLVFEVLANFQLKKLDKKNFQNLQRLLV